MSSQQSLSSIIRILLEPALELWEGVAEDEASVIASSVMNAIDWEKVNLGGQAKLLPKQANPSTVFGAFSFIEAVQWISLGAQTGALPRVAANVLIRNHLDGLKKAAIVIHGSGLLNSDSAAQLAELISSGEAPQEFQAKYPTIFRNFPEAPTVFTTWCSECGAFIQSEQARVFILALISSHERWTTMLSSMTNEKFEEDGEATISPIEGYLVTLQHLDRIGTLLSEVEIPNDKRSALTMMRVPFGRLHGWRFNLDNLYYRRRFADATDVVGKRFIREGGDIGISLDSTELSKAADNIVKRYLLSIGYLSSQAAG